MAKSGFIVLVLFLLSNCLADTFTKIGTGQAFDGYATSRKKGQLTQVRVDGRKSRYVNLSLYEVRPNRLGRKNKVHIFTINESIDLASQAKAFEKALTIAADQGPQFILIELDTASIRPATALRIVRAIAKTDNCRTVAFVNGGKIGGAFDQAVIVAFACDKLYMNPAASIGAMPSDLRLPADNEAIDPNYAQATDPNALAQWQDFARQFAEQKGSASLFIKAMLDDRLRIIEVSENGKTLYIDPRDKTDEQTIVSTLSERGQPLTLNADLAQDIGLIDAHAATRQQLFTYLDSHDAAQVKDRSLSKARRTFERGRRMVNRVISSILRRRQRVDAIGEEIAAIEEQIIRSNAIFLGQRYSIAGSNLDRYRTADIELDQWERILIDRDDLLMELAGVLADLQTDYRRAIPIAKRYHDLHYLVEIFNAEAEDTQLILAEVRSQFRYQYW